MQYWFSRHGICVKLTLLRTVKASFSVFQVSENATGTITVSLTPEQCQNYRNILSRHPDLFYFGMTGVWERKDFWAADANLSHIFLTVFLDTTDDKAFDEAKLGKELRYWAIPKPDPKLPLIDPSELRDPKIAMRDPKIATSARTPLHEWRKNNQILESASTTAR